MDTILTSSQRAKVRKTLLNNGVALPRRADDQQLMDLVVENGLAVDDSQTFNPDTTPAVDFKKAFDELAQEAADEVFKNPAHQPENQTKPTKPTKEDDNMAPSNAPTQPAMDKTVDDALNALAAAFAAKEDPKPAMDEARIIELIKEHAQAPINYEIRQEEKPEVIKVSNTHSQFETVLELTQDYPLIGVAPYLVGPAGSGKTTLAHQVAKALDLPFYCTGALFDKFELTGYNDANGKYIESDLYRAFTQGGVFLFDELDGCAAEVLTAFNQLLANDTYAFPNGLQQKHKDFRIIAAGNTVGAGAEDTYNRAQLDGATRDRFTVVFVTYCPKIEFIYAMQAAKAIRPDFPERKVKAVQYAVEKVREWAKKEKLDVIISPRKTAAVSCRIARGKHHTEALDEMLRPLLSDDQRKRALQAAAA